MENAEELKAQIEAATSDLTIELNPGVYSFEMSAGSSQQINNTRAISVTLVGATDPSGNPVTQFLMGSSLTVAPGLFVRRMAL
ncbi:hypothetical protein G7068_00555 [Leucobacter viscericola]|uniref:Uncharacterized protein n=1 Tax=Leucobacter viscericola TaxID=2714935 RepID=A0A6G7XBP5_9MICO|nr:hypothetical protein [Leucobacter viscericola]QIK61869.1 hypothetical protein G7068_00555 [Leucobacter viscericola]